MDEWDRAYQDGYAQGAGKLAPLLEDLLSLQEETRNRLMVTSLSPSIWYSNDTLENAWILGYASSIEEAQRDEYCREQVWWLRHPSA